MSYFTMLILLLLILALANNLIMYNKCYVSNSIKAYDPNINKNISIYPVNIYISKQNEEKISADIKNILDKYASENNNKLIVVFGYPTENDISKINTLAI